VGEWEKAAPPAPVLYPTDGLGRCASPLKLGVAVGVNEGATVGGSLGLAVGSTVGTVEGTMAGIAVGDLDVVQVLALIE
jgi:hypothetical protein